MSLASLRAEAQDFEKMVHYEIGRVLGNLAVPGLRYASQYWGMPWTTDLGSCEGKV